MAIISKGIKLSYKRQSPDGGEFKSLDDLYEIPELGGDVDKIEVTNLESEAHAYINGIRNYGDTVSFKFYYEKEQFKELAGLVDENKIPVVCDWKVELPDATTCTFSGAPTVKLDGASYNVALTYSLNIAPSSEMVFA
jgi:hypothetical protein